MTGAWDCSVGSTKKAERRRGHRDAMLHELRATHDAR
jgi:hypothetical protein